jgi:hypothetical protein
MEVLVANKSRTGWDGDKLEAELGERARDFKKQSDYAEVSCRTRKEA